MPALRSTVLLLLSLVVGCGAARAEQAVPGAGPKTERAPSAAGSPAELAASGYLVVISVQASAADALASFKVLQAKYAAVLGQYQPVIKRVDLGEKGGVRYRAAVGPFETKQQASAMCGSLKLAGGQCFPFGYPR
ncbi:SPOR domain-containing protein [Bradyrhizobium sp. STM 3809]|uniref:SPOR domain-containing protein n=1 Tax=Bradyrhizobium sp. STM 3809 TaxID=551936 RepID=UPI0002409847|nr:SPOR domain-containing protein [Bradyrhizobium sp. STM 3809]CCE01636.1 conserved exported hypothetical protein [Bradyrhizobium sp. STM 3809]